MTGSSSSMPRSLTCPIRAASMAASVPAWARRKPVLPSNRQLVVACMAAWMCSARNTRQLACIRWLRTGRRLVHRPCWPTLVRH